MSDGGNRRPPPGPKWVKGQSGNPSGLSKQHHDFVALCRDKSPEVVERLAAIVRKGGVSGVRAAEIILAYAHGRPATTINANVRAAVLTSGIVGAARAALEAAVI